MKRNPFSATIFFSIILSISLQLLLDLGFLILYETDELELDWTVFSKNN